MTTGRQRVLHTLRQLGQFYVSSRIVNNGTAKGTIEDRVHVGRIFGLLADEEILVLLSIGIKEVKP